MKYELGYMSYDQNDHRTNKGSDTHRQLQLHAASTTKEDKRSCLTGSQKLAPVRGAHQQSGSVKTR